MLIGILQCDDVRSSLSESYGEYPEMFEQGFSQTNNTFSFKTFAAHKGDLPETVCECDGYLITGSRHSVFDKDIHWTNSLMDFVVKLYKAKIPTVGVCFGHQLISEVMGGQTERADNGWQIGVHTCEIKHFRSFMKPSVPEFNIAMLCEDQIQKLGEEAVVLASAPNCPYAMLQYGDYFLSLQGHPEFSPDFAKSLLNLLKDEFPSKRFQSGYESLSNRKMDSDLMFKWFAQFFINNVKVTENE